MTRVSRCAVLALVGCGGKPSAPPPPGAGDHTPSHALDAARAQQSCVSAEELPAATLGSWKVSGHVVSTGGDARIAVLADTGGATPETIAALARVRAKLDVDLVITLGGLGTTQSELETVLGVLATKVPVIALPGDLEAMPAQIAAIAALQAKGEPVVDGRLVRRIDFASGSIATIGGARAPQRLVAGADGCIYAAADVAAAYADLSPRSGVRILATAEAPRREIDGDAAGELGLLPIAGTQVDVHVHGGVDADASPTAKGGHDGEAVSLTPGSADATTRLVSPHAPSAGVLAVKPGSWTWTPIHDIRDGK